jgi:hypothetical protein
MKPTLLILAAGMASRYGSMKQIQSFGPSGETIMDYSILMRYKADLKKSYSSSAKILRMISKIYLNRNGAEK